MPAYQYTAPFQVAADTTVRFVAVAVDGTISDLQESAYQFYQDAIASAPSFSATATLTPPTVTAQSSAAVSVPSFSARATLTPPTVTTVSAGSAVASVPSFTARATLTVPSVTGQQQGRVNVPSFTASAAFTPPSVSVTLGGAVSATVSVPAFSATAVLIPPTVTANTVSSGSIRGPDGKILDIRDIYGNPIELRAAA